MRAVLNAIGAFVFVYAQAASAAGDASQELAKANDLYQAGDCKQAIAQYAAAAKRGLDSESALVAKFRSSYCKLNLGDAAGAEAGFSEYLKQDPGNDEAKLRLAESQFNQGQFAQARASAAKVSGEHRSEAMIFSARAAIETGDSSAAIRDLNSLKEPGEWKPAILYWKGVALYSGGDSDGAVRSYKAAIASAPKDHWARPESEARIKQIESERQWFHAYLTLGYISDSNVAQSAAANFAGGGGGPGEGPGSASGGPAPGGGPGPSGGGGGGGGPGPGPGGGSGGGGAGQGPILGPPRLSGSSTISDTGKWLSVGAKVLPYVRSNANAFSSVSFSSPYYSEANKGYDYAVFGWDAGASIKTSGGDWWGGRVQLLKTWYDVYPSQDYLIFDPWYSLAVGKNSSVRLDFLYNKYLKTDSTYTMTPMAAAYLAISNDFGVKLGAQYISGKGQQATYASGTPPSLISGSMFSNYATYGASAGVWWNPFGSFEAVAQAAYYKTNYERESIPIPAGQPNPGDRADALTQYSIELTQPIVADVWSVGASATFSKNASSGIQGIPNQGTLTTYSYDRAYYLISTTVSY